MKRRRILLALLLVLAAAVVFAFWPRGPKQPVYQGKKLRDWIEAYATPLKGHPGYPPPEMVQRREAAQRAIEAIGTNALPWLMHELSRPESKWAAAFNRWAAGHPSIHWRLRDQNSRRAICVLGLFLLRTNTAPVLPALAGYLHDPQRNGIAWQAMVGAGDLAVPFLLTALTSTNEVAVQAAGAALTRLAPDSELAVTNLVPLLKTGNERTRIAAAYCLRAAGKREDLAANAIADALTDDSASVQWQAEHSLSEMGPRAKAAIPELQRLYKFSTGRYERMASNALYYIDPAALGPPRP